MKRLRAMDLWPLGVALGALLTAIFASLDGYLPMGVMIGAFVLAILLGRLPVRVLGIILIAATFMSRLRLPLLGLEVLVEQAALVVVLFSMTLSGRLTRVNQAIRRIPSALYLFLFWGFVISVLYSPDPWASLTVSAWMAASLFIAVVLVGLYESHYMLIRDALLSGALTAGVAISAWLAALTTGSTWGIQKETLTGTPAAYGLSFEANILGGMAALWLLVAVFSSTGITRRFRKFVMVLFVGAIIASLTRAAILGVLSGLLVTVVLGRRSKYVFIRALPSLVAAGVVVIVVLSQVSLFGGVTEKAGKLVDIQSVTGKVRTDKWTQALHDMNFSAWVGGQGVNSYGQRHIDPTRPSQNVPDYLGNMPLQVVYDTGLVGLALIMSGVWSLVRTRRELSRSIGLLVAAFTVGFATSPLWFGNLWIFVAIAVCSASENRRDIRSETPTFIARA